MDTKISKKSISKFDIFLVLLFNLFSLGICFIIFKPSLYDLDVWFLTLPVVLIITTVIHEYIHILFFKLFGQGKADIKITRSKEVKGIIVLQRNKAVKYSLNQILIILLSPLILISIISILIALIAPENIKILIGVNMWLNCVASSTDVVLSFKRYRCGEGDTYFEKNEKDEVIMNVNKDD